MHHIARCIGLALFQKRRMYDVYSDALTHMVARFNHTIVPWYAKGVFENGNEFKVMVYELGLKRRADFL